MSTQKREEWEFPCTGDLATIAERKKVISRFSCLKCWNISNFISDSLYDFLLLLSDSFKDNIWINTTSIFHVMKLNQSTVLKQWSCFKNHTCYILHYIFESNLFNRKMFCVQRLYALRKLIIYYWFPKSLKFNFGREKSGRLDEPETISSWGKLKWSSKKRLRTIFPASFERF